MKLYKIDSNGNVLELKIYAIDGRVVTESGVQNGVTKYSSYEVEEKNIGRSNYRDIDAQAEFEAENKIKRHIEYLGYFETVEEAMNNRNSATTFNGGYKPMKAHKWDDHKHKMKFPCIVQAKIDGMRCIAECTAERKIKLWASSGRPIKHMDHIIKDLEKIMIPGEVYDGELYNHGMPLNKILSIVRSEVNPKSQFERQKISYYLFDAIKIYTNNEKVFVTQTDMFSLRYYMLAERFRNMQHCIPCIELVDTYSVSDMRTSDECYNKLINDKYEGMMYRNPEGSYEQKRSYNILKRKGFQEEDFEIESIEDGKGKLVGIASNFICKTNDGALKFKANINGTEDYRRNLLIDETQWKGKYATVRFLNYSEYGIPVLPKCIAIRDFVGLD